jgi:very-short-patch-repair endonuclease
MRVKSANHRDQVVGGLADGQHGVVSREQLMAAGVGRGAIVRALDAGRLRLVFRGVYAVGHVAMRREGWWMAALLACGEGAALSHRTAATHWDLLSVPVLPIDVITPAARGRRHRHITTHRTLLDPLDALTRDRLRVTTPARTIVDLAATLEGRALREVVERAEDLLRFDPTDIRSTLARAPKRPGTKRLNDLITLLAPDDDNARSHLERLFLTVMRKANLPKPRTNHEIAGRRRDFAWPDQRLVVETDGYRYHSSRAARRRDNRRDRQLTALGWRTVRFSYEEVAFEPGVVGAEVKQLLRNARTAAT